MKIINRKSLIVFFILPILFLSGCSIGKIKLVEKVKQTPKKNITYGYVDVSDNDNSKKENDLTNNSDIKVDENADIVCSVDGSIFKKNNFTVKTLKDTDIFTKPSNGDKKSIAENTRLSVIGVSDDDNTYLIKIDGNYYFILALNCYKDESYDSEQENNKRLEAEKQKQEEDRKRQEEERKRIVDEEKRRKEEENRKRKEHEDRKRQNNTNSKTTTNNNTSSNNVSLNTENKTVTKKTENITRIPYPNDAKYTVRYNMKIAIVNKQVYTKALAPLYNAPFDPNKYTNVYSYGKLRAGQTLTISGITSNGFVEIRDNKNRVFYIDSKYLSW